MSKIVDQLKYQFRAGGMYLKLIYVNTAIFIFFGILTTVFKLLLIDISIIENFKDSLSLYSEPIQLIKHPWGIFTYMFMHQNFWHLFGNMLILFFLGQLFEQYLGQKKLLSTYIIGGLFGALIHLLATYSFPFLRLDGYSITLGASASVMAVFSAVGFYAPNKEIHLFGVFKLKLIVLTLLYILLDFLRLSNDDNVAHFAHLGGALWGFLFIYNLKKGKDLSAWFNKFSNFFKNLFSFRNKIKIVHSKNKKTKFNKYKPEKPPKDDYTYNQDKKKRQERVDQILDKIKDSGYDSLSKAEKDFLFDASKNI